MNIDWLLIKLHGGQKKAEQKGAEREFKPQFHTQWKYFFFNFILFFNFTILYWFCHISKWIHHRYTCVPHPEPSLLPPHTLPLGHPSAPAPSIQYRASNRLILIYISLTAFFSCAYLVFVCLFWWSICSNVLPFKKWVIFSLLLNFQGSFYILGTSKKRLLQPDISEVKKGG